MTRDELGRRLLNCRRCEEAPKSGQKHTCPYQIEIFKDSIFKCRCCGQCVEDCDEIANMDTWTFEDMDV